MSASRLKYAPVVSLSLTGGCHRPTAATAPARFRTALVFSGTDPCPATPRAVSSICLGIFSSVWTEAYFARPSMRLTLPPSARQYSASISAKCWSTMNWMPTRVVPSSPASARKITSRSSGTFSRLSSSIVINDAVTLSLSSTVPRP